MKMREKQEKMMTGKKKMGEKLMFPIWKDWSRSAKEKRGKNEYMARKQLSVGHTLAKGAYTANAARRIGGDTLHALG
jgi:hypothetical protein